jgi:hypothetical protein
MIDANIPRATPAEEPGFMNNAVVLSNSNEGLGFFGTRQIAKDIRQRVERLLQLGLSEIVIDFTGVKVSQSFADELIGVLIMRQTPAVLERLTFKGCAESVRAVLEFVVADRYDEYVQTKSH